MGLELEAINHLGEKEVIKMARRYAPCVKKAAKRSGISPSKLQKSYNRGIGAYRTNPGSVRPHIKSPEEWAYARVYASVNPSSKAYKIDKIHLKKK